MGTLMHATTGRAPAGKSLFYGLPYNAGLKSFYIFAQNYLLSSTTLRNYGSAGGSGTLVGGPTIDAEKMTITTGGSQYLLDTLIDNGSDYTLFAVASNLDISTSAATQPYPITNQSTGGNGKGVNLFMTNGGTSLAIVTIARASNVVTVTCTNASNPYTAGQFIVIANVTGDTTLNGSWLLASSTIVSTTITLTYFSPGANGSYGAVGTVVPSTVGTRTTNWVNVSGTNTIETANASGANGNQPRFLAATFVAATGVLTAVDFTNNTTGNSTAVYTRNPQSTPFCFGGNPLANGGKCSIWMAGIAQAAWSLGATGQLAQVYGAIKTALATECQVSATISGNTMTVNSVVTGGVVTPGMMVIGAATGTQVLQQITAAIAGGPGTYYVSVSQTVATATTFYLGQII